MKKIFRLWMFGAMLTALLARASAQSGTVTIQAGLPGAVISSNLFGIFFEEISMAGDGGIYAELVRNRSFEDASTPVQWTLVTAGSATGTWAIDTSSPLSASNTQSLRLTMTSGAGNVGAVNSGYYGIAITNGGAYNFGIYARGSNGFTGPLFISLENASGSVTYAATNLGPLTTSWQHFSGVLVPNATDAAARLTVRFSKAGTVYVDFVSLFPAQTWNNRTNGLRSDLAGMLTDLKPSFMRFPGGSWVDGFSLADAYHWGLTIGDPANRTERANLWGYEVSNGLGYHEYLRMCEDLGTSPLFCINCGMDVNQNAVPTNQLSSWVQEALDAIQYANGDSNTPMGAQRAANGHPAPFNLQYMEIGNENNGIAYNNNYGYFYRAIKANYPGIHIIANSQGTIPTSAPVEIVDQHYYSDPGFFENSATLYDGYSRSGPKVFVGEYAVTSGSGDGNLAGALGEAAFMTGMERNSDVVAMAAYAPLFANLNNKNWNPDLIYFNGTQVYGTPSYYVQQMFSLNRGNVVLPTAVSAAAGSLYVSSSLVPATGLIVVKAVNVSNSPVTTTFNVNGVRAVVATAALIQLTSANATNENSASAPNNVFPTTSLINNAGMNFTVVLPANSLSIFRLRASGFNAATNLQLQVASPLNAGQIAAATVFAQLSGQTNLISLAGNHAVTYSSADTNIASADNDGRVTGVRPGTTTITATYNGLSATNAVQVLPPLPTVLAHRYSFSETSGSTVADSAGGPAWNGTLPNGGSFGGGQVSLAAASQQYVKLPAGILSNYNEVTIETWVTFADQLPVNCFFFGFGNTNGTLGENYIFCAPQGGRIAITSGTFSSEENAFSGIDFSFHTNLHLTAVFDPPAGYVALYLDGILAEINNSVTTPFSEVDDVYSYIGRSLFGNDPYPDFKLDEFRIYNGALQPAEIQATQVLGPNALLSAAAPSIVFKVSGGGLIFSWPVASANYNLMSCSNLVSGTWSAVTAPLPQIVGNKWQVVIPIAGQNAQYFRLEK